MRAALPPKKWSDSDLVLLELFYPSEPVEDLAEVLGRTCSAVKSKARLLGVQKRKSWTAAQIRTLRRLYPHQPAKAVAATLDVALHRVYNMAHKLHIPKSKKFKTIEHARQVERLKAGAAYRYPKGHVPANKGTRRPGWAPGRMAETQFKKGERRGTVNINYKPVGTILPDADGYLVIKIYDAETAADRYGIGEGKSWEYLHRRVWTQAKGPIPPKHHVAFVDGNRNNVDIENLELVSFREMARRNRMWTSLPRELAEVIHLTGVLKRKLKSTHVEK